MVRRGDFAIAYPIIPKGSINHVMITRFLLANRYKYSMLFFEYKFGRRFSFRLKRGYIRVSRGMRNHLKLPSFLPSKHYLDDWRGIYTPGDALSAAVTNKCAETHNHNFFCDISLYCEK